MSRRQTRARWRSRLRAESGQGSPVAQTPRSRVAAVSVRIEELHLQSFSRLDGRRIADAFQHELSSLLADGAVPDSWLRGQTIEKAKLGDLRIRAGAKTQIVGEQLAQALLHAGEKKAGR